jgi:hypothetical protein
MDEALMPRESKGFVADEGAMARAQGNKKRGWGV